MEWTNIEKVLEELGLEAANSFRQKLEAGNNNATKALYNGVGYRVQVDMNQAYLYMTYPDKYFNANVRKLYLETGRLPGKFVPVHIIEKWVVDKNIPLNGKKVNQVAYLINRNIRDFGIKPRPYIQQIRDELRQSGEIQKIRDAFEKDVKSLLKIT